MPFSPTCSHSTQLFPRNSNSNGKYTCQDRRNRIAADIENNEAFPDRETNPTDFDKLEGYNPNRPRICSPMHSGQIIARPRKWGLGTIQKIPSRESWGNLSGDRYIICPKPPYPAEKILNRRQLCFLAIPPWPVIKRLCPPRTIFSAWRWSSESLSNINRARL